MSLTNRFSSILLAGSLALVACGGDDGGGGDDDGQVIDTSGTHYKFVADTIVVPANANEATQFSLDLDGDDRPENALGGLLGILAETADLDVKTTVQENIDDGTVIVLADVQATDLTAATGVGMRVFLGANPTPAACTDPEMQATCGQHLGGDASFELSATSPEDAVLVGTIIGGAFKGGPGSVTLELPLAAGQDPVVLTLIGARMECGVTATGLSDGILAGAITNENIENDVLPAVVEVIGGLTTTDCTGEYDTVNMTDATCCTEGSSGAQVLDFFNTDESMDCIISLAELKENDIIATTLLNPDLDLLDASGNPGTDGMDDSLSLGVGFSGVNATFTLPAGIE